MGIIHKSVDVVKSLTFPPSFFNLPLLVNHAQYNHVCDVYVSVCRYYYCARPHSGGESRSVRFETGGIYSIILGEATVDEEVSAHTHTPLSQ